MPAKTRSVTKFLNMDLDIHAQTGLEQLLRSISSSVMVLHQAEQKASVELNESFASLEETAVGLVKLDQFHGAPGERHLGSVRVAKAQHRNSGG